MRSYNGIPVPEGAKAITYVDGKFVVPDDPIIPFIEGDGSGRDIWKAASRVFDAAVKTTYGGRRRVVWYEVFAGEKAFRYLGEWLPFDTLNAIKEFRIAIKGPLVPPVGGGIRAKPLNLRAFVDLYAYVQPVKHIPGVPSPVKHPDRMNVVIFRENTEDVYVGIEWRRGTPQATRVIEFINELLREDNSEKRIRPDAVVGIKPISITASKRLVRRAIRYALEEGRKSVTLVHKGNIMKFTEGAFRDWGYELAREEFGDVTVTEDDVTEKYGGKLPPGKVLMKDRIADAMLQQVLTRPEEYDVLAAPNLNGDYLSDACAAQVGGLGWIGRALIGDGCGVFEVTHGTAPKYADKDVLNPSAMILTGAMMFRYVDWRPVADLIEKALAATVIQRRVTYDLERQMRMEGLVDAQKLGTSAFASAIIENMDKVT